VGVVRKVSGWSVASIHDEYKSYVAPKIRDCDLDYLAAFDAGEIRDIVHGVDLPRPLRREVTGPLRPLHLYRAVFLTMLMLSVWFLTQSAIRNVMSGPY
jgi:hypothetical protein